MKAHRNEAPKPFEPVILTLETQAEVNAVYALLNHSDLREAVGLPPTSHIMMNYRTDDYHRLHRALCDLAK